MKPPSHIKHHRHLKQKNFRPKKHTHTNLIFIGIGIVVTVILAKTPAFTNLLLGLGQYSYVGAVVAGMLFVLTPTATTGALMLAILSKVLPLWALIVLSGVGAMIADIVMLQFVESDLLEEIEDILNQVHGRKLIHIFHTKALRWTLPVLGAVIIASPLPDELGVGLMGITKISPWRFSVLSWVLNSAGIFTAMSAIRLAVHA